MPSLLDDPNRLMGRRQFRGLKGLGSCQIKEVNCIIFKVIEKAKPLPHHLMTIYLCRPKANLPWEGGESSKKRRGAQQKGRRVRGPKGG